MKIKPRTYYNMKLERNTWYKIQSTGLKGTYGIVRAKRKWVYIIARQYNNQPLERYDIPLKWVTIDDSNINVKTRNYKVKRLSKEDLFLELL